MAQASGPSHLLEADPNTEAEIISQNANDLEAIQSVLNNSNDSLLQEFCCEEEEEDDDDTLSNGSDIDICFSLSEVEIGNDRQAQTKGFENTVEFESILNENAKLKAEITQNRNEIDRLKEKLTKCEELVSQLTIKLEHETEKRNKTTKSLKQEISEAKHTLTAMQNDKAEILDKKTIEKNAEKHFSKKLNDMDFEITDVRDLIKKNADNNEKLLKSLNDLKRNMKENTNTIKKISDDYNQPRNKPDQEKMQFSSQTTTLETPIAEPNSTKAIDDSVRMRPPESRGASSFSGPPKSLRNGPSITGEVSTLIVGDSILKGIFPRKIDFSGSTKVRTLRGRQLHDVRSFLANLDLTSLDNLIIHAGTNDVPKYA